MSINLASISLRFDVTKAKENRLNVKWQEPFRYFSDSKEVLGSQRDIHQPIVFLRLAFSGSAKPCRLDGKRPSGQRSLKLLLRSFKE
jgi:hypothetical protein